MNTTKTETTKTVAVAAVKKTRHGAYGRRLATVTVTVPAAGYWQTAAHEAALPLLAALLPRMKITTEIVDSAEAVPAAVKTTARFQVVEQSSPVDRQHPIVEVTNASALDAARAIAKLGHFGPNARIMEVSATPKKAACVVVRNGRERHKRIFFLVRVADQRVAAAADLAQSLQRATGAVAVTVNDGDVTAMAAHTSVEVTKNYAGRPALGRAPRKHIAMRIDPDLLATLRTMAAARDMGYQQLIHQLLEAGVKGGAL